MDLAAGEGLVEIVDAEVEVRERAGAGLVTPGKGEIPGIKGQLALHHLRRIPLRDDLPLATRAALFCGA